MLDYTEENIIDMIYDIVVPQNNTIKLDSKFAELAIERSEILSRDGLSEFIRKKKIVNNTNFGKSKEDVTMKCFKILEVFEKKGKKGKTQMLEDYFNLIDVDTYYKIDIKKSFFEANMRTNKEFEEHFVMHLNRTLSLHLMMVILGYNMTTIDDMYNKYITCDTS